jgi:two-component system, sensor histidine kinase YesM
MRSSIKKREVSLFIKIFLVFLLVILPLYLFSIQIITTGKNDVRKEIIEASNSKVGLYLNTLENDFFNIIKLETRLMSDSDLLMLSRYRDFDYSFDQSQNLLNLQRKLAQVKDVSQYVENAFVLIPYINMKVSYDSISELQEVELSKLANLAKQNSYPFTYSKEDIYILLSPFFIMNSNSNVPIKPSYIICVKISQNKVREALADFFKYSEGGSVVLGDKYGLNIKTAADQGVINKFKPFIHENNAPEHSGGTKVVDVENKRYIISYKKSMTLNSTLVVYQPEEELLSALNRYSLWIWLMSLLTIIVVILFSIWIKRMIMRPLDKLITAFNSLDCGDLNISVNYNSNDEFGYLYKRFNSMCKKFGVLIKEAYEEKLHAQSAELKQLQYQINPHFLYNCFFLIYRLAKMHDEEHVIKFTQHLGNYYQFVTRSSADEVPLIKELQHAKDYIEIQTVRFSNRINVELQDIPKEMENLKVPKLILQPIIENAYNHGLKDRLKEGFIKISFIKTEQGLSVSVENNGDVIEEEKLRELREKLDSNDISMECTGLINVHRRLKLKYGTNSGIRVFSGHKGGLKVEIHIELKEENNV